MTQATIAIPIAVSKNNQVIHILHFLTERSRDETRFRAASLAKMVMPPALVRLPAESKRL
jgi:hypothetical protein